MTTSMAAGSGQVEHLFIDTNVLIYLTDRSSSWHRQATEAVESARQRGDILTISRQIIREYLARLTRTHIELGRPPLTEIVENVRIFQRDFRLLEENDAVTTILLRLVETVPMGGRQVHDANIVATMQAHGIRRLLTNNGADFARFASFMTIIPL
jgi:predicted nucleic acid-binding protein